MKLIIVYTALYLPKRSCSVSLNSSCSASLNSAQPSLLAMRMWTVRRLLLMLALSAVLPATIHARLLTYPFTTPHHNVMIHGRKLLEEGIDMTCLAQHCVVPLAKCLAESGCMKALLGVQMCKEDPLLTKLKSMCYPFPVYPLLPPLDACVNLAIYSFKDNTALGELTKCAQTPPNAPIGTTCLTGVTKEDMSACGTAPVESNWKTDAFTDPTLWAARFQVGLARPQTTYTVVKGLNHGWDCMKSQRFQFTYTEGPPTELKVNHTLDLSANMGPLRYPYLTTLGGANTANWDISFSYCLASDLTCTQPGVWREDLTTAGIHESDPWLVLDIDPPLDSADAAYPETGANFALVLMAVNVGPVDGVTIPSNGVNQGGPYPGGVPGGYILARDGMGLTKTEMANRISKLQAKWATKYGTLSFPYWCKLY